MTKEELQFEWDRFLVESFYVRPSFPMSKIICMFKDAYGVTGEEVFALLRTPKFGRHIRNSLSRFICGFLPTIADTLWKHDASRSYDIAKSVNKLKSTTRNNAVDDHKVKQDFADRHGSSEQYRKARIEKSGVRYNYDKYLRNNQWDVVK